LRYRATEHDEFAATFNRDSVVVLRSHFDPAVLRRWYADFEPLLAAHLGNEQADPNRGSQRFYVTLPFKPPFADPAIYEDPDVLAIVERVVGPDAVMCQLATDTPLKGSEYQTWHADTPLLFPETDDNDTPSFQIAVNFPLVEVTDDNGPLETTLGTHRMTKAAAMDALAEGRLERRRIPMALGDLMIRDVRAVHRGTPNLTDQPRPMVVIGYSRRWLYRPEVHIRVPESTHQGLSERARQLLRFNRWSPTMPPMRRPRAIATSRTEPIHIARTAEPGPTAGPSSSPRFPSAWSGHRRCAPAGGRQVRADRATRRSSWW
jgi:hypothetical protein